MNLAARQKVFIVVYPEGYNQTWNAGRCCGAAMNESISFKKKQNQQ